MTSTSSGAESGNRGAPSREAKSESSAVTVAIMTVAVFVLLSGFLAVLAYRNFSVVSAISPLLLLTLPVAVGFWNDARRSLRFLRRISLKDAASSFGLASLLLVIQSSSVRSGANFFANFPNQKIEAGEGFNIDSSFHVSLIQSILARGFPSTGQHLEPLLHYHTLSHYGDALILLVTGLDPWESYALLYFAKAAAIVMATIFFSYRVTRGGRERLFWVVAPLTALIFTNSWGVVISHANWLPMFLLPLVAPRIYEVIQKPRLLAADSIILTLIVVVASLGKVSVGFSIAIFVGLVALMKEPGRPLVYAMGAIWVGFFLIWARGFGGPSLISNWADAFREIPAEAFSLAGLGILLLLAYRTGHGRLSAILGAATLGAMGTNALVGYFFLRSPLDTAAFFSGLFAIVFLITAQHLLGADSWGRYATERNQLRRVSFLATALALLVASAPALAKAPLSPFNPPMSIVDSIYLTNTASYQWFNALAAEPDKMSILTAAMGKRPPADSVMHTTYLDVFGSKLATHLTKNSISPASALLFLSDEQFDELSSHLTLANSENTGFLLVAVTGVSLVHGMPPLDSDWKGSFFGNSDYTEIALRLKQEVAHEVDFCRFDRPVVTVLDLDPLRFETLCSAG